MLEVIFRYKDGKYPFGRGKDNENTFMDYLIESKTQHQVNLQRQLNGIFKKIDNINIMRLVKVLKQNLTFHMIYEFHDKPLEKRLWQLTKEQQLADIFVELENVFETLITEKLKAQIYLDYMGVDQNNRLKVWIKPDEVQYVGNTNQTQKKIKKNLLDFYETQRTRIHLQIEQIFQSNQTFVSKQKAQKKDSEKQKNPADNLCSTNTKVKTPNFVIEGNTLVFMNTSSQKSKGNTSYDSESRGKKQSHLMSKANHLVSQERPISKVQNNKNSISQSSATEQPISVDLSKMSIAQKVLYYKRQKQLVTEDSFPQKQIIVKDSSVSSTSHNDESKSSNNDSGIHIKTEKINKHKIMIITSQQVEVQGNSDDDLQKMAREKIAHIQKKKLQRSHDLHRKDNNSTENAHKGDNSLNSGHDQKYLKGLDENSQQQKPWQKSQENQKQINSKILQAKLKAKSILEKYGQKLKK